MLDRAMPGHDRDDFKRIRSPFEGNLVRLRAFEEEDILEANALIWDPDVSQHLAIPWPEPIAGTHEFWERTRVKTDWGIFAIETLAGEFAGLCGLEQVSGRNRSAELGIWIGKPYWDKGYGTDAVRTLCRFGFREMNLQRVHLRVYETNPRGRRAYEKVGFKEEGRLRRSHFVDGRYVDVLVMGLLGEDLIED
jgi:RimJ/RimL family protein N-acetyltransferase